MKWMVAKLVQTRIYSHAHAQNGPVSISFGDAESDKLHKSQNVLVVHHGNSLPICNHSGLLSVRLVASYHGSKVPFVARDFST